MTTCVIGSTVKRCMQSLPLAIGKSRFISSPLIFTALTVSPPEAKAPDHFKGPVWLGILWVFFRPHVLKAALKYGAAAVIMTQYDSPGSALLILLIVLRIFGVTF